MGYMHINNLYKSTEILLFKECYALEKIHGTSANISWRDGKVNLMPGGCKYDNFKSNFNVEELEKKFRELFDCDVVIYGEAYGGSCQGMSGTYGKELKFVAFDVSVDKNWLDVPNAKDVATKIGLTFVDYEKVSTDLESLDKERDKDSVQAVRNGCGDGKIREGVVLRPIIELKKNNGDRIIAKHKGDDFLETATKRKVDPERMKVLEDAKEIADEWVTPMRLTHVLDKLGNPTDIKEISNVIKAMKDDVIREAKDEIIESKDAFWAIGKKTAELYKKKIFKVQE